MKFLDQYLADGNEFLKHIVTGYENWILSVNPETEQ